MLTTTVHLLSGLTEDEFQIALADELATLDGAVDELVASLHPIPESEAERTGFQAFDIDDWDE